MTVQKRNRAAAITANQAVAAAVSMRAGGLKSRTMAATVSTAPAAIRGRRRPKGVFIRSEMYPMAGSVKASNSLTSSRIRPMVPMGTPTASV